MNTIQALWYAVVATSCVFAMGDWRRAIYLGILIDAIRDPVRKLCVGKPVAVTLSGALVWLAIIVAVVFSQREQLRQMFDRYPKLRTAFHLLIMALIPAAGVAIASYHRGWIMAGIGGASYLIPCGGILVGYAMLREEADAARFMLWYIIVNCVMLISVPLEYMNVDVPALGGIDFHWIRHRTGYIVNLLCGWYRSPDIMGLHAAHVMMFSLVLAIRPLSKAKAAWIVPVLWGLACVLLSGRRKMIAIPLVFLAVFLLLGTKMRVSRINRMTGLVLCVGLIGAVLTLLAGSPEQSLEYTQYASTLFTEGFGRSSQIIVGSTLGSLQNAGIVGGGLGAATQGNYYAGVHTARQFGWQEDGISRLVTEFGVFGVVLLCGSLYLLLRALANALSSVPTDRIEIDMQLCLVGVIAGDAASFVISHQQFSGDPINAVIVTLMIGMVLKMPSISKRGVTIAERRMAPALAAISKPVSVGQFNTTPSGPSGH